MASVSPVSTMYDFSHEETLSILIQVRQQVEEQNSRLSKAENSVRELQNRHDMWDGVMRNELTELWVKCDIFTNELQTLKPLEDLSFKTACSRDATQWDKKMEELHGKLLAEGTQSNERAVCLAKVEAMGQELSQRLESTAQQLQNFRSGLSVSNAVGRQASEPGQATVASKVEMRQAKSPPRSVAQQRKLADDGVGWQPAHCQSQNGGPKDLPETGQKVQPLVVVKTGSLDLATRRKRPGTIASISPSGNSGEKSRHWERYLAEGGRNDVQDIISSVQKSRGFWQQQQQQQQQQLLRQRRQQLPRLS
mmetsp:Transcript_36088/g.69488  ORF Transcript_36088/g.69488 Transcript_36088/m.69488 type:complete len:308 (+) Transcript_36088:58-981(+)